jgi:hypothetical protein
MNLSNLIKTGGLTCKRSGLIVYSGINFLKDNGLIKL